ncbi:unnamed protein product [[Actinomadura] parvosata subsp. kistnae]|uniref:Uncharacterized protein n=1 Tax=[Actinomadura] parvosata subsp. kistnae TaxID=1909395 RepID=A0A1U9ZSC5_9ACTN|nr:hypothetical protein [Nonomuraea sp. ATCC 55076]AQZ60838.1 hypothetical protein BKM31_04435 [Nonomuraea sp. ATCC 55076]SPL90505.1 unnamed protein product [Actinomadura parvosata subsp. kistnae]
MAKGCLYALLTVASTATILVTCLAAYLVTGSAGAVLVPVVGLLGVCAFLVARDTMPRDMAPRRALTAEEARRLARERDHVRRTVDFVADPDLTEEQRLTIIDSFIPGRGASRAPYRDRLVLVPELSPSARALLERARAAVMAVYTSRVMRRRLLDGLANEVLLPRQIWEIATLLRLQTDLHEEQERAMRGVVTPELMAVLEPQQEALRRSVASVTARVERLERYARRVQEADAALRAREALDNNDKYRDLLARTDDTEGMRDLEARGAALEETLAESVRVAIDAGRTLSLDRPS